MIRTIAKAAVVAVAAASLNVAYTAPAHATPAGRLCSFTAVTDPTVENGQTYAGQINGGPVTDDTQVGATITLTCTIQVGAGNNTHAGADAVALSNTGTGAVSVAGQASFVSPDGQPVYLCTEVTVNGTTYYRDSVAATWSSSNTAACGEAISQEIFPGPLGPVIDIIFPITDAALAEMCLQAPGTIIPPYYERRPDGIYVLGIKVWDCPMPSLPGIVEQILHGG